MMRAWAKWMLFAAVVIPYATGCGPVRARPDVAAPASPPLATAAELAASYNANAAAIRTLLLDVDVGSANLPRAGLFWKLVAGMAWLGGRIRGTGGKSYLTVSGYLLLRKPSELRMFGTLPLVGGRAFDLASDGNRFELSLPTVGEFIQGRNDCAPATARSPLRRLRPSEILEALPAFRIPPADRLAMIPGKEREYGLRVETGAAAGDMHTVREMFFSRSEPRLQRQIFYDGRGERSLIANYGDYTVTDGVAFPRTITLEHPGAYSLLLSLTQAPAINRANPAFNDARTFALKPGPGVKILDQSQCLPAAAPDPVP